MPNLGRHLRQRALGEASFSPMARARCTANWISPDLLIRRVDDLKAEAIAAMRAVGRRVRDRPALPASAPEEYEDPPE